MEIRLEGSGDRGSPAAQLQAIVARMREVSADRVLLEEVEAELKRTAMTLVRQGYLRRISPDGVPWKPGKSGGGDLVMSGSMFSSVRVEDRPSGFAVISRVAAIDGSYYGGSHQYGRTIRANGYEPLRQAVKWNGQVVARSAKIRSRSSQPIRAGFGVWAPGRKVRLKMRAMRVGGKYLYSRTDQTIPLRWRTPDGQWHSAYKIRIPARPIVPRPGRLPVCWANRFEAAAGGILQAVLNPAVHRRMLRQYGG